MEENVIDELLNSLNEARQMDLNALREAIMRQRMRELEEMEELAA